jgi:hypothetical protein
MLSVEGMSVEVSAARFYFACDAKRVQTRQNERHFDFLILTPPPPLFHSRLARRSGEG